MSCNIKLKIKTPSENLFPGRGFYQVEEDILQIVFRPFDSKNQFFSYLEFGSGRIDINKTGHPLLMEIFIPRKLWPIVDTLQIPTKIESAEIKIINFREKMNIPVFYTNSNKNIFKIVFNNQTVTKCYGIADHILVEVNNLSELIAIWVTSITDDLAGKKMADTHH